MSDNYDNEIWVSNLHGKSSNFVDKQGLQFKYTGHDWEPAEHYLPASPPEIFEAMVRASKGARLNRNEMPEAAAIFSEPHFNNVGDFVWFKGFIGARGQLAQVLKKADCGAGGGLVPIPVFKSDLKTLVDQEFFLLNWGDHTKDSFEPSHSTGVEPFFTIEVDGKELWSWDGISLDVAVNESAFDGPDIWMEPRMRNLIFMKGWLAREINKLTTIPDLALSQCRILEGGK